MMASIIIDSLSRLGISMQVPIFRCWSESIKCRVSLFFILVYSILIPAGCSPALDAEQSLVETTILADGKNYTQKVSIGTTVQGALEKSGMVIAALDRVDPPSYTVIIEPTLIQITRVKEVFEIEEVTIPFERQTVRNESLPEGQTMLIQAGVNGVQQITYRRLFEDDVEVSRNVFKSLVIAEALPEIVMVGVQAPFTPVTIPGKLVYLTAGNAWLLEETSGNRRPVVTTGDLDGRVFSLSSNGEWLLYTRKGDEESEEINSLWVVNLAQKSPQPISLRTENIVHFADWRPGSSSTIAYSTVEPRSTAPGWQANNDLHLLSFNASGTFVDKQELIEANSGGIYGWWGSVYAWSPDGKRIAYARPDGVGLVELNETNTILLIDITPLQTRGDWAWVPGIGWSPDNDILYLVNHAPMSGLTTDETSPLFDLNAYIVDEGYSVNLIPQTGMFAYPSPSPVITNRHYLVAFLQAIFPEQSESSRYRLMIMDRDGSNRRSIFPPEGSPGLEPQKVVWGPSQNNSQPANWLAVIYQGNLWLLNLERQQAQQITGDGSISKIDWR